MRSAPRRMRYAAASVAVAAAAIADSFSGLAEARRCMRRWMAAASSELGDAPPRGEAPPLTPCGVCRSCTSGVGAAATSPLLVFRSGVASASLPPRRPRMISTAAGLAVALSCGRVPGVVRGSTHAPSAGMPPMPATRRSRLRSWYARGVPASLPPAAGQPDATPAALAPASAVAAGSSSCIGQEMGGLVSWQQQGSPHHCMQRTGMQQQKHGATVSTCCSRPPPSLALPAALPSHRLSGAHPHLHRIRSPQHPPPDPFAPQSRPFHAVVPQ